MMNAWLYIEILSETPKMIMMRREKQIFQQLLQLKATGKKWFQWVSLYVHTAMKRCSCLVFDWCFALWQENLGLQEGTHEQLKGKKNPKPPMVPTIANSIGS